jgi:hypothetical protein
VFADDAPFATTGFARIRYHLPGAAAATASAGYAEEALLKTNLSAAGAGAAGGGLLAIGDAAPVARVAGLGLADGDLGLLSEDRVFQFNADVGAQISAALRACSPASSAKRIAKSKEVTENFAEILEGGWIEPSCRSSSDPCVTEAVILRALVLVRKDAVGFARFLELFFRAFVPRIAIRMILHGELAIGALQLLLGAASAYGKDFVIIALNVGRQCRAPFISSMGWWPRGPWLGAATDPSAYNHAVVLR